MMCVKILVLLGLLLACSCDSRDRTTSEPIDDNNVGQIAVAASAFLQENGSLPKSLRELRAYLPGMEVDDVVVDFTVKASQDGFDPLYKEVIVRVVRHGEGGGYRWHGAMHFGRVGLDWIDVSPVLRPKYPEVSAACDVAYKVHEWIREHDEAGLSLPDQFDQKVKVSTLIEGHEKWFVLNHAEWVNQYAFPWTGPRAVNSMRVMQK